MIGQEARDVERKITAILQILSDSRSPMGSRNISRLLAEKGIRLGERAVRYHLKIMDERGMTRSAGHKDGRTITGPGLEELRNSLVTDKIGFINTKIERLAYQTTAGLRSGTGVAPIDISFFRKEDYSRTLRTMLPVFEAGLCSSGKVAVATEGGKLGDVVVATSQVALATLSSVAVNGCLLKSGIPAQARFSGLLQIREGQPLRFVDLIKFSGSTMDPSDIFLNGRMTDVTGASVNGEGKVLASYHEIPTLSTGKARELLHKMQNSGLISFATLGKPGERLYEVPFNPEKVGLVIMSGLNPAAAAAESGIDVSSQAMCGMMEVARLKPVKELI
ncbi:MAG: DUF128 domain-containing protein [Dehalococcoidia bacterium]|nr:DUF128 domain-containing protein [Dehalococcoidia bacterium]